MQTYEVSGIDITEPCPTRLFFSTGENAQEIQLIKKGCPMFDFVAIQSQTGKPLKNLYRKNFTIKLFSSAPKLEIQVLKYIFQLEFFDSDKIIQTMRSLWDAVSL